MPILVLGDYRQHSSRLLLTPIIGLIIKLEDGGPIFYRSRYVRPNGQNGYYLKFRTMRVDADQILNRDPEMLKAF